MKKRSLLSSEKLVVALAMVALIAFSFSLTLIASDEDQVLRLACKYSDASTFDPHRAGASQDTVVVDLMFNALLRNTPGTLAVDAIIPDLAAALPSSKILPDGRQEWVFELKQGVMTHPYAGHAGYELTSEDVVYSLQKSADSEHCSYASLYQGMTFEALNKYAVRVIMDKPISESLFLPRFVNHHGGLIVPKKPLEEKGEEWFRLHPVGTGPFVFQEYIPLEKVVLTRNEEYFRGAPLLAGVQWWFMPNQASREMALQKGELDVVEGPKEQSWGETMAKLPGIQVEYIPTLETITVYFNMTVEPLNLLQVRQAIAHAVNREEFVAVYGKDASEANYSLVPVGQAGGLTRTELEEANCLYEYSLSKAKALLAEAGYPNGFSLDVFTSESTTYKRAYELIQAQLRRIGIDIKLSVVDHSTFHARIRQDLNPLVIYSCRRDNADVRLNRFHYSEATVVTGKMPDTNFSHFGKVDADGDGEIESVDSLIVEARTTLDSDRQVTLWKEVQLELLWKVAACPLITVQNIWAKNEKVDWGYEMVGIVDGPKPTERTEIKN